MKQIFQHWLINSPRNCVAEQMRRTRHAAGDAVGTVPTVDPALTDALHSEIESTRNCKVPYRATPQRNPESN